MIPKNCTYCGKPIMEKELITAMYKHSTSYWHNICHELFFSEWLDRINPDRQKNILTNCCSCGIIKSEREDIK